MKHVMETKEVAGQNPNYLLAKVQDLVDWAVNSSRANSLWPMPFGTACCAIEFMATAASRYDFARFGMERQAFSPRQADVLICAGRLPFKLAPLIRRLHDKIKPYTAFDAVTRRDAQPADDHGLRLPPDPIDDISEPFGNADHQFRSA